MYCEGGAAGISTSRGAKEGRGGRHKEGRRGERDLVPAEEVIVAAAAADVPVVEAMARFKPAATAAAVPVVLAVRL